MQDVAEEDPDYLLKLVTLSPPKTYIPSFLKPSAEELPVPLFSTVMDAIVEEEWLMPFSECLDSVAVPPITRVRVVHRPAKIQHVSFQRDYEEPATEELAPAVATQVVPVEAVECTEDCDIMSAREEEEEACAAPPTEEEPCLRSEERACEAEVSVDDQQMLEEEVKSPSQLVEDLQEEVEDADQMAQPAFANDVLVFSDEEDDCCEYGQELLNHHRPPQSPCKSPCKVQTTAVVPSLSPEDDNDPNFITYSDALRRGLKGDDLQYLAELVFEIKSLGLDSRIDVSAAEDLIFAD
jgi:hypothetical protein